MYAKGQAINENNGKGVNAIPVQATAVPTQAYTAPPPGQYNNNGHFIVNQQAHYIVPKMNNLSRWNVDLFEKCCNCSGNCWFTWCCFCPTLSAYSRSINVASHGMDQRRSAFNTALSCIILCLLLSIFIGPAIFNIYIFFLAFFARLQVRKFFDIEGNGCLDCLTSLFCAPCSIIQISNQLWDSPDDIPGCDPGQIPINHVSHDPYTDDCPVKNGGSYNNQV